eukprot:GDKI01030315.1.p1 GENE.GDKI01030315.1~~GDKI01030315.1.p1  ORF type:complete len:136 (+),score=26.94 GDKI01030315.1:88-495(+)
MGAVHARTGASTDVQLGKSLLHGLGGKKCTRKMHTQTRIHGSAKFQLTCLDMQTLSIYTQTSTPPQTCYSCCVCACMCVGVCVLVCFSPWFQRVCNLLIALYRYAQFKPLYGVRTLIHTQKHTHVHTASPINSPS